MGYRRFTPHPALQHLVECLWVQESEDPAEDAQGTTVLPVGRLELLVHFWEPFERLQDGQRDPLPMAFMLGQRTRPMTVRPTGRTGLVIVGFLPWVADALLGGAANDMVDTAVPLDLLDRCRHHRTLAEQVEAAATSEQRAAVVEELLLGLLANRQPDPLAVAAVGRLDQSWGRVPIRQLARELEISRRQLQRRFRSAVGIGPKQFARLVRFQKAIGLLRGAVDWPEVIDRCGFFDQAHLIHELKAFSGHTPVEVQSRGTTPLMHTFNATVASPIYTTIYL